MTRTLILKNGIALAVMDHFCARVFYAYCKVNGLEDHTIDVFPDYNPLMRSYTVAKADSKPVVYSAVDVELIK